MKLFHVFCIVMFFVFSALQYNDVDKELWMLHYCFAAFISLMELIKPTGYHMRSFLITAGAAVYVAVFAFHIPLESSAWVSWKSVFESEDGREAFGALICLAALGISWLTGKGFEEQRLPHAKNQEPSHANEHGIKA